MTRPPREAGRPHALTAYPLSGRFRERLEERLGVAPAYVTLSELRALRVGALARALRALGRGPLLIPLETTDGGAILSIVQAVALLAGAAEVQIVHPDLRFERVRRPRLAASWLRLLGASISGALAACLCHLELRTLARAPRIPVGLALWSRVLYLKTNLWLGLKAGGSVAHTAGVVNALLARGREVDIASPEPPLMVRAAARVHRIAAPAAFGSPHEFNYYRFHRRFVAACSRLLDGAAYSAIYQRLSIANYAGVVLSRRWGIPLVLEYNGSEAWVARHWGSRLRWHRLALRAEEVSLAHAHLVVTVSEVLRRELEGRGVEPRRIVCYPNCVDPDLFDPARYGEEHRRRLRASLAIPSDAVVVTFVGTFGQWHGIEVLAEAIRALAESDPECLEWGKLRFLLVGDGLRMTRVRETLAGAAARFVTLTGLVPQDEAPAFVFASDVLVSPHVPNPDGSAFFGSPTKLFEYMASGKAIIASDLEQIGEVLRPALRAAGLPAAGPQAADGSMAVLTRPGDPGDVAAAIRFLVDRPDWREHLGRNARREALAKYTWDKHVEVIEGALQALQRDGA